MICLFLDCTCTGTNAEPTREQRASPPVVGPTPAHLASLYYCIPPQGRRRITKYNLAPHPAKIEDPRTPGHFIRPGLLRAAEGQGMPAVEVVAAFRRSPGSNGNWLHCYCAGGVVPYMCTCIYLSKEPKSRDQWNHTQIPGMGTIGITIPFSL